MPTFENTTATHLHVAEHVVVAPKATVELSEEQASSALVLKSIKMGFLIQLTNVIQDVNLNISPTSINASINIPIKSIEPEKVEVNEEKVSSRVIPSEKTKSKADKILEEAINRAAQNIAEGEKKWNPMNDAHPDIEDDEDSFEYVPPVVKNNQYGNKEHNDPTDISGVKVMQDDESVTGVKAIPHHVEDITPKKTIKKK